MRFFHLPVPSPGTYVLEMMCGFTACVWATWTFFGTRFIEAEDNYAAVVWYMPILCWAALASLIGVVQMATCFFFREYRWLRAAVCFVVATFWIGLALGLYQTARTPGISLHFMEGFQNVLAMIVLCVRRRPGV